MQSRKRSQLWKIVAVAVVVLVAIGIVALKPRGHSAAEPSRVSPPRTEVKTEQRLNQPMVPATPPSRPEVATGQRSGEVEVSVPPPSRSEVAAEERSSKPEPSGPPAPKAEPKPPETPPPQTKLPLLLDIGSNTCIPCKKMAPILEELKEEYKGVVEVKLIDIYKERDAASKYRIMVIPTQIFYDQEGREFHRHLGFMGKEEILQVFKKMGVEF
jgi:thioredoxin 1